MFMFLFIKVIYTYYRAFFNMKIRKENKLPVRPHDEKALLIFGFILYMSMCSICLSHYTEN